MSEAGRGMKPNSELNGKYGITSVMTIKIKVLTNSSFPGRLRKNKCRVRTTNAITSSVSNDSMNQPVRNSTGEAWNSSNSTPKVRKSKIELTTPKRII